VNGELPATAGVGIAWRLGRAAHPPASVPAADEQPVTVPDERREGDVEVIDSPRDAEPFLVIDAAPVLESEDRDTLGVWADSVDALGPSRARRIEATRASRPPVALDAVTSDDLRRLAGLDSAAAAGLAAALRERRPGDPSVPPVPPALLGAWREAAPYLTARRAPAAGSSESRREPAAGVLRWRRETRVRPDAGPQGRDRVDLRLGRGTTGVTLTALGDALRGDAGARGALVAQTARVRCVFGTGGDPLVWGTGLVGRPVPMDLRTDAGEAPARQTRRAAALARPIWRPQLGSDARFAGVELVPMAAARFAVGGVGDRRSTAALLALGDWLAGALWQGSRGSDARGGLWLRRSVSGRVIEFESLRNPGGNRRRAIRAAVAERPAGSRSLWWLEGLLRSSRGRWRAQPNGVAEDEPLVTGLRGSGGVRFPGGAVGLSAGDEVRWAGDVGSDRRSRRGAVRAQLTRPDGAVGRLRIDATASGTRPSGPTPWSESAWRWRRCWRVRADLREPVRRPSPKLVCSQWGLECGLERSTSASAVARTSWWAGSWLERPLGRGECRAGFFEVGSGPGVDLAPTWCSGLRSRVSTGLWFAGGCSRRSRRLDLSCHGLHPVFGGARNRGRLVATLALDLRPATGRGETARRGLSRP
jgi:hypothetical protein